MAVTRQGLTVDQRSETICVFRTGWPVRPCRSRDQIDLNEIAPGARLDVRTIFAALLVD